ncbi:hypothetical protein EHS13_22495 [Paenibacillus psychroresistens]|uniref:DUF559 domain-containing protein n=1 Tax=Paenibacillus psychroresistens TaxID=1778678 RepID=A0A6B8RNP3_9BACL|nr:hypothetical protein [Paenibacillus psychroresistens]QGQ97457.1 hypothetical protein EHS13_22495 [Paenibacillus psychroresistens]
MDFDNAHKNWLDKHLEKRTGERRGRLERGHQHGEILFLRNVWWALIGNLDDLHPEYEILDLRRRSYFADFAWLPGPVKVIWEIKGYDAHVRDMDRNRYCEELNRETFLQAMGFRVVSFAYDDVAHRPELCITLLRLILSRYKTGLAPVNILNRIEREIVLLAYQLSRPIRPIDIENHLVIDHRNSVGCLQSLCKKEWLRPIPRGKGHKILHYELLRKSLDEMEW